MAIYPLNRRKTITSRALIECVDEKSGEDDDNDRVRFLLIRGDAIGFTKINYQIICWPLANTQLIEWFMIRIHAVAACTRLH